jgi:hypothetical protein
MDPGKAFPEVAKLERDQYYQRDDSKHPQIEASFLNNRLDSLNSRISFYFQLFEIC